MAQMKEHWDAVYDSRETTQVGWYEETPEQCMALIEKCNIDKDETILDVGVGASTLIDNLISLGYTHIVAVDISEVALDKLRQRLGESASSVTLIADDLTNPEHLQNLEDVAIWHDRAVLHFLTQESDRDKYLATLHQVVKVGGYVILAAFSLDGAPKCSGLDVRRYDEKMLQEFLGDEFKLIEHHSHLYHMPSRDTRPYIYTLFQRM